MRGAVQPPVDFVDTRIAPSRENTSVAPSGVNAASASLDGPEINPGAKISGASVARAPAAQANDAPRAQETSRNVAFISTSS